MTQILVDKFSRRFEYLRLSLTDACNYKCRYCLPNGYKPTCQDKFLNEEEIIRLVKVFVSLGMWKIRLTGGEPTLRRDFEKIALSVSKIQGVKFLAMSTNGFRLLQGAHSFYAAGVRGLNVSLDSLDRREFYEATGRDEVDNILKGIDAALEAKFHSVKINAVLFKKTYENNFKLFLNFISKKPIDVRFIELMQTNENLNFFKENHISSQFIIEKLIEIGFRLKERTLGDGPAQIYTHEKYKGNIGVIAPYSKNFCTTCNRLRVSSRGILRLCLFGTGGVDLRPFLQNDNQKDDLINLILESLKLKKESHFLNEKNPGDTPHLASIGG